MTVMFEPIALGDRRALTEASPSTKRSRGCTPKRMRTAEEVEALSRAFSADWRAGDQIMTWLKRREGKTQELSNLVRDGWSWTDVGRAMAVAGIHYRFGEPMSAAILRKKASEARAAVRNRNAGPGQERDSIKAPAHPGSGSVDIEFWSALQQRQAANRPAQLAEARTGPAKDEEPEFRPARLKRYEPARTQQPDAEGGAEIAARPGASRSRPTTRNQSSRSPSSRAIGAARRSSDRR